MASIWFFSEIFLIFLVFFALTPIIWVLFLHSYLLNEF